MKTLTKQNAKDILVWFKTEGQGNWGGWGNYPNLPVSASYLQYDTNPCQINLSPPVEIDGECYSCITNNRPVGTKWAGWPFCRISFTTLQNLFEISDSEIAVEIKLKKTAEELKYLNGQLSIQSRFLNEKDEYVPFVADIEKIFLKSERSSDNFIAPIGKVIVAHGHGVDLSFSEEVEWIEIREQGKNGRNKKRVFAPVSIPADVQEAINLKVSELRANRKAELKNRVSEIKSKIDTLK